MDEMYKVYALADDARRVVDVNSDAFLDDVTGWVQIDEGYGDKYHHAQGNYLPKPKKDERGVYRYKLDDADQLAERTAEEMDADYVPPSADGGNDDGDLAAKVAALQAQVDAQAAQLAAYEAAYAEGVQNA